MDDNILFEITKREVVIMSKGRVLKSITGCNSVWKFLWDFVFAIYAIGAMAHEIYYKHTVLYTCAYVALLFAWFFICVFDHYLYRKQEYELNTKIKLLEKLEQRDDILNRNENYRRI